MNIDNLLETLLGIFHQYSLLVTFVGVIVLFIVYKNPKASFKFGIFLLFMAAAFYAVSLFSNVFETGSRNKDQMINKTRKLVD